MTPARVLTIAGSDSGGGAGIEADLKTIERLGGYGMAAITAVTAQNTRGVHGIWPLPAEAVARQIEVVLDDIGADAVKTGMLGSCGAVEAAAGALRSRARLPLVIDPVMVAKGGARLLDDAVQKALCTELLPLATLITPNLPEAQALTGIKAQTRAGREAAARRLVEMGAAAALVKGGHTDGETVEDLLYDGKRFTVIRHERQVTPHTHGTGCTLSAAIAAGLGQGMDLAAAVERASRYVQQAIRLAPGLGSGHGPLGHSLGALPWT